MKTGADRMTYLIFAMFAIFLITSLNISCGGGSSSQSQVFTPVGGGGGGTGGTGGTGPGSSGSGGGGVEIPPTFFGMTIPAGGQDFPPSGSVPIGALGHPSTLAWGFIEKSQGTFDFTAFDTYVNDAVQHGLVDSHGVAQVTITFGDTPQWAAADTSNCTAFTATVVCPSPPAKLSDWTNFVQTVISHYNGTTAPHVKYYELWNEASSGNFWTGSIQDLLNLAAIAYPIIHQDPFSQLLTPSVSGPAEGSGSNNGLTYMTSYLQAGGNKYADGGTFHGYVAKTNGASISQFPLPEQSSTPSCASGQDCFGSVITKQTAFRQLFDSNGLKGKPMLDTEGSWGVNANLPDANQEAAWVAQWFILQAAYYPQITQAVWFTWGSPAGSGQLESSPGVPNTAGTAYGQVYNWLVGATFTGQCSSDSNQTWTCPITRSGGYQALVVWNENGNFSYSPSTAYKQFRDLAGNVSALSGGPITIGTEPFLLENQNP
ncbi:MAG TPA: hypothetical protein VGW33_05785 [Terriglobia bacterium]|nr:hypothetical protein [Terriglobia bacterium]